MHKASIVLSLLILLAGCCNGVVQDPEENTMNTLTIEWQRLVDEAGNTCDRCGATGQEVDKAVASLKQSLEPLGVKVVLETAALSPEECKKDISQSNRIWLAGRPLEEWLAAEVGQSPCDTCCEEIGGAVECRTLEVDGNIYEALPAALIVKAGLKAGSELLPAGSAAPCCDQPVPGKSPCCSPKPCGDNEVCK